MGDALVSRYWCHMCSQMVNPVMEVEIKCPFCESGFVEEMDSRRDDDSELASDRALSLWAPILLGMLGGPRSRRFRREDDEEEGRGETEQEWDSEAFLRRRRRSSVAILQLLQGLRAVASESENPDRERDSERDRNRVILINPFNQGVFLQGSSDSSQARNENNNLYSSLGDYFIGPGLDLLLQLLAENDPNRYGTLPAQKEAIEAMPAVKVVDNLQCSICLEDLEIGSEAKEMPCKHKFHNECILPWLELHSSCPVCRFQMPADESKCPDGPGSNGSREERVGEEGNGNGRRFWVPVPWPFNGLFSVSGAQTGPNPAALPESPSTSAPASASHPNEN